MPVSDPGSRPGNAPANGPPTALNVKKYFGVPAQSSDQKFFPQHPIDLAAKFNDFKTRIQSGTFLNGHWFFYSRFMNKHMMDDARKILSDDVKITREVPGTDEKLYMPYISDAMPIANADLDLTRFRGTTEECYFWAVISRAYAQSVSGRAYIAIPETRPTNIPKDNGDGSVLVED